MPAVLDELDAKITSVESQAAEAKAKAEEKRAEITNGGDSLPEVGTDDFKALTDELQGFYADVDRLTDEATGLKSQRATVARTIGDPAVPDPDVGGEAKGISPEQLAELVAAAQGKSASHGPRMGSRIVEGKTYKDVLDSGIFGRSHWGGNIPLGKGLDRAEFKDLVGGGATGAAPFKDPMRTPYLPLAQRPVRILELLQTIPTDSDSIKYAKQTTAGHNVEIVKDPVSAEPVREGSSGVSEVTEIDAGIKPESNYAWTTATADIETLAHTLPVHKNQLSDVPQLEAIINEEMIRGLYLFLEKEVVTGAGGAGHFTGIENTSNIVSQAISTYSMVDAIHRVLTGCRLLFEEPNTAIIHPTDWQTIRLLRDDNSGSGTGPYLFGPPSQAGDSTLWGMNVVVTPVVNAGFPIIGDFSAAQLYLREGVQVLASDSHKDFFTRNLVMLLAEMRVGFGVRRPGAFGKVTT